MADFPPVMNHSAPRLGAARMLRNPSTAKDTKIALSGESRVTGVPWPRKEGAERFCDIRVIAHDGYNQG